MLEKSMEINFVNPIRFQLTRWWREKWREEAWLWRVILGKTRKVSAVNKQGMDSSKLLIMPLWKVPTTTTRSHQDFYCQSTLPLWGRYAGKRVWGEKSRWSRFLRRLLLMVNPDCAVKFRGRLRIHINISPARHMWPSNLPFTSHAGILPFSAMALQ